MSVRLVVRTLCAAAIGGLVTFHAAQAQQQPSAVSVSLAREVLELKGGLNIFDPVASGIVEHHKNLIVQVNPTAGQDAEVVAAQLRKEMQARVPEIQNEIARGYAEQFSEAELKELVAFYKTPLGRKVIDGEPKALDGATKRVDAWAEKVAAEVAAKMRAELKKRGHSLL